MHLARTRPLNAPRLSRRDWFLSHLLALSQSVARGALFGVNSDFITTSSSPHVFNALVLFKTNDISIYPQHNKP
jgi:hypothetical protein